MADADSDNLDALAWPGFVDILSSVIIMFVFFLMIVAAILYFHTILYISKIKSDQVIEKVESEFEFEFKQQQTEFAESTEQDVIIDSENKSMVIFFGKSAISLLPDIKTQIQNEAALYNPDEYTVRITTPRPERKTNITQRKVAVARLFNARNAFLDSNFPQSSVIPEMVDHEEIDGSEDWVKIEILKK